MAIDELVSDLVLLLEIFVTKWFYFVPIIIASYFVAWKAPRSLPIWWALIALIVANFVAMATEIIIGTISWFTYAAIFFLTPLVMASAYGTGRLVRFRNFWRLHTRTGKYRRYKERNRANAEHEKSQ